MSKVMHGPNQPNELNRDEVHIQHDKGSNKVLALWAGAKNDTPICIHNKAVQIIADATDYALKAEDRYVALNTTSGVATATLPKTGKITDGHEVRLDDAGGNAGTNNITVDTPGNATIENGATFTINSNDAVTIFMYNEDDNNWVQIL